jgi:hypothetical protein
VSPTPGACRDICRQNEPSARSPCWTVPQRSKRARTTPVPRRQCRAARRARAAAVEKLLRDPSLRHNKHGRQRLLLYNAIGGQARHEVLAAVPRTARPSWGRSPVTTAICGPGSPTSLTSARLIDPRGSRQLSGRNSRARPGQGLREAVAGWLPGVGLGAVPDVTTARNRSAGGSRGTRRPPA